MFCTTGEQNNQGRLGEASDLEMAMENSQSGVEPPYLSPEGRKILFLVPTPVKNNEGGFCPIPVLNWGFYPRGNPHTRFCTMHKHNRFSIPTGSRTHGDPIPASPIHNMNKCIGKIL
jgi:hypothetical protein